MNLYFKLKMWLDDTPGDVDVSKRFSAYLIDWFLGSLCTTFPLCLIWMFNTHDMENMAKVNLFQLWNSTSLSITVIAGILSIFCALFYYVWIPYKIYPGQTVGKRTMNIKIVKLDNTVLDLKTLIIRQVVGIVVLEGTLYNVSTLWHDLLSIVTGLNFTGILMYQGLICSILSIALCMLSNSHRMIHDRLAKTKVMRIKTGK
ncbi:MAG: RDD family protein [Bacillota bacterium]|nr:RDD family protein [Bacillota bacterium]